MPVFRVTFGFAGGNTGWTETHSIQQSVTQAIGLLPITQGVARLRASMLGSPFVINGTRISIYSDGGAPPVRSPIRSVFLDKTIFSYAPTPTSPWPPSEPSPVQLQAQGFASIIAPAAYQGNENWTYLGGPFDDCVTNAGQVLPENLGLAGNFNSWKQLLTASGFGWLAVTKVGPQLPITTMVNTIGGQLQFTTPAGAAPLVDGGVYNIRVAGVNAGRSPVNGAFVATWTAATHTWTTREQVAFVLAQEGGYVQPYARVLTHVPYGNLVLSPSTIKHKRGKPFLSPPGRARKRIRA